MADADGKRRKLVPFAKAYSGLTDAEIGKVDAVDPQDHGREIRPGAQREADAGVRDSASKASRAARGTRAASPCAFRACCAWRDDKPVDEADTLDVLKDMLA